jgi:hypothetical protein
MRINDLLIESTNQLDEGPKFNKFGQAIGNVAGMAAKGIGAVAGGIAGLGAAAKKGFQAGKSQVAATDDGAVPAGKPAAGGAVPAGKPAAGGAVPAGKPAAGGGTATKPKGFIAGVKAGQNQGLSALNDPNVVGSTSSGTDADDEDPAAGGATTPPSATDINKAGPKGTAQAKPIQGTVAKQAAAKTGAALAGQDQAQAGQTMYTQVKANIDKLDKKGKQRILQLLQKSMAAPAAGGAAPVDKPAAGGAPANTMANAPVSKTNTAKPGNPNAAPAAEPAPAGQSAPKKTGGKVAGQVSMTPGAVAKRAKRTAAASTNSAGAGAFGQMAKQAQTAGKINTGSMVLEGFSLFRKK